MVDLSRTMYAANEVAGMVGIAVAGKSDIGELTLLVQIAQFFPIRKSASLNDMLALNDTFV